MLRIEKQHPVAAVCIPPGARLILRDIPSDIQSSLSVRGVEHVTFTQLDVAENRHRDAVRFDNGAQLSVQNLADGQRIMVLSLGSQAEIDVSPEVHAHVTRF